MYRCNFCEKELKLTNNAFWNLRRHIAKQHPSSYDEVMKHFKDNSYDNIKFIIGGLQDIQKSQERLVKKKTEKVKEQEEIPKERKPRRCWIKKYCEKVKDGLYRCILCRRQLRMYDGLYGNMKRHIRSLHPTVYHDELKIEAGVEDEIVEYIVEYVETNNLDTKSTGENSADEDTQDIHSDKAEYLEETELFQDLETSPMAAEENV